jgi:hypothetical protein
MYGTKGVLSRIVSADSERSGQLVVGTIADLLTCASDPPAADSPGEGTSLPFAVNGRRGDRGHAEYLLARSIRDETKAKDAPLARWVDRRLSWRLSYCLARTPLKPNHVTIVNTLLGFLSGYLFHDGLFSSGGWRRIVPTGCHSRRRRRRGGSPENAGNRFRATLDLVTVYICCPCSRVASRSAR